MSENLFTGGRELTESFKLIRKPIHWFANWFDQAFVQNGLRRLNYSRMGIAQRKLDGAFGINWSIYQLYCIKIK